MDKTNFSNNIKRILNISLLLSITIFCNINSYASDSLQDYLNNSNNILKFNTNSIENNSSDITNNITSEDFIIDGDNNITFIDVNTIQLLNNTGGGEVKASIAGSNNISLQQWTEGSTVPSSITFSGNNSNYTGTLYLHPLINTITFNNPNSVINNINFPNSISNTGDDKDTKPFVVPSEARKINIIFKDNTNIKELTINDNLITNLQGNINTNKLNLSNTSALKLSLCSHITLADNGVTNSLNIGSEEYIVHIKHMLQYVISAQYDYTAGKCLYHYPTKVLCTKCDNETAINEIQTGDTLLVNEDVINQASLSNITCNNCNTGFLNIILHSYLYPNRNDRMLINNNTEYLVRLYCSICNDTCTKVDEKRIGAIYILKSEYNNKNFTTISDYNISNISHHTGCTVTNNDNLIYDPAYVLAQLNKAVNL